MLSLLLVGLVWLTGKQSVDRLNNALAMQEQAAVKTRALVLAQGIRFRLNDLRRLVSLTHHHASTQDGPNLKALEHHFLSIATVDPVYLQVRLLNSSGQEILRVNRHGTGAIEVVAPEELQDKQHRPYFQAARELDEAIYVSPFTLNEEHGQVAVPHESTIRLAAPVRVAGELFGVVVLNLDGDAITHYLAELDHGTKDQLYLVNEEGFWLVGPSREMEWGFQLPESQAYTISTYWPAVWPTMQAEQSGQRFTEHGLVTFATVWPPPASTGEAGEPRIVSPDRWMMISHVTAEELPTLWGQGRVLMTLSGLAILAVSCWFWARNRVGRKLDQERLKQAESRFRALFDQAYQFVGLLTPDGTLVEANETALAFAGIKRQDVVGKPFWKAHWWDVGEDVQAKLRQSIKEAAKGKFVRYEVEVRGKEDELVPIDFSLRPMVDDEGNVFMIIPEGRDISALKEEREALRQSRQIFANAFDYAPIGMALLEPDGSWLQVNAALCQIVGYPLDELIQLTFQSITHPDDLEADLDNVHQILAKEIETYTMEKRYIRKDGELVWVQLTVSMVWNPDGSPRYFIAQVQDISQAKATTQSLIEANEKLDRSNRDLAQFAYVASHDLQEPLRMVSSFVSLLEEKLADSADDETRQYISFAVAGAERMQRLIKDLLAYSRINTTPQAMQRLDLNEIVDIACADLDGLIHEHEADIQVEPLGEVTGDATLLRQLVQNLLANAIRFHRPRTPPIIRISADHQPDHVTIAVTDNGIGIEEKHQERVFQIFKRLNRREDYPGTGIGLAACKRVAERHDGEIWFQSKPGIGTTFFVSLPQMHKET